ncbi:MAG: ArnT family glycosyltransferase, partial [Henriciella sp.]
MQKLQIWSDSKIQLALGLIIGLLTIRIGLIYASPLELYADEAQYWRWSTTLDWGYYSKPPMIAWVIHASTSLFGHSEIGVRLFAPVLHTIAATFLLLLTRRMFGPQTALITTAAYLFMPGIVLSSTVISTDGVLFPFWCAGLYLFWRLREGARGWI